MKIRACLLAMALAVNLVGTASATESSVELRQVSFSEILSVSSGAGLDELLYPTVSELPTKYLDLYMFADTGMTSVSVSPETVALLQIHFPSSDGKYTWAELYSAQLYVSWYGMLYENKRGDTGADDLVALQEMMDTASILLEDPMTSTMVTDVDTLKGVLLRYEDALDLTKPETEESDDTLYQQMCLEDPETGVVMSAGREQFWKCISYEAPLGLDLQDMVKWYQTRPAYMGLFGITSESSDRVINQVGAGTSFVIEEQTVTDEDTLALPRNFSSNGYIGDFDVPAASTNLPDGTAGIRDILLTIAIVLTVLCVIAFAVVDFVRKWNDPMRKWRWPRW